MACWDAAATSSINASGDGRVNTGLRQIDAALTDGFASRSSLRRSKNCPGDLVAKAIIDQADHVRPAAV